MVFDGARTLVMGVLNVTPDSFSDGGRYRDPDVAIAHGLQLVRDGADILDIGGEATNPRATPISADEELARVLPVLRGLAGCGATLSIDTTKAEVARAAIAAGATIVNDVSGGLFDPDMGRAVDQPHVTYIVGHLRGRTLAEVFAAEVAPTWAEVAAELEQRLAVLPADVAVRAWVDPGLGFGKGSDPDGNLDLLMHVGDLDRVLQRPVVVGPSRKRFVRKLAGGEPSERELDEVSTQLCLIAVKNGANVLRAHNVALLRAGLTVYTKM